MFFSLISVEIPRLVNLYLGTIVRDNPELMEMRLKILGWIMSIPEEIITKLKQFPLIPLNILLYSATLYTLVKVSLSSHFRENDIFNI